MIPIIAEVVVEGLIIVEGVYVTVVVLMVVCTVLVGVCCLWLMMMQQGTWHVYVSACDSDEE